jgi:3-oxoacyl-[acyl-carrier-protein] synthase-3
MNSPRAGIRAIASFLPAARVTNEQLSREFGGDWTPSRILEKTGISARHVAAPGECASDLGVAAARRLFEAGACAPGDIDFLVFCTQSPDYFLPATACLVQTRLELPLSCGAIDLNQGCSGFVYGLAVAKGLVESGSADNVLLVTADTYSKYVNARDRGTRTLFGDGAAATLVSAVHSGRELIGPFVFGTDGRGADRLVVPAGGCRRPVSAETGVEQEGKDGNWRSEQNLYMNGPEIFSFTLQRVPPLVKALLAKSRLRAEEVDRYVFHQASRFMLEHLRSKLGIPSDKFSVCLSECGNTVSSTIPIALENDQREGRLRAGLTVMAVGFGVGLSWAGVILRTLEQTCMSRLSRGFREAVFPDRL